jgi:hypothetical protein
VERRTFEFVYVEISLALSRRISRYDLWVRIWESGGDPDDLDRAQVRRFVERGLDGLLTEEGVRLAPRARRRLERRLCGFEPSAPTPEEWLSIPGPGAGTGMG